MGTSRPNLVEMDAGANGRDGSAASPEPGRRRFRRLPATPESERGGRGFCPCGGERRERRRPGGEGSGPRV